jgi:hypothetical protein
VKTQKKIYLPCVTVAIEIELRYQFPKSDRMNPAAPSSGGLSAPDLLLVSGTVPGSGALDSVSESPPQP